MSFKEKSKKESIKMNYVVETKGLKRWERTEMGEQKEGWGEQKEGWGKLREMGSEESQQGGRREGHRREGSPFPVLWLCAFVFLMKFLWPRKNKTKFHMNTWELIIYKGFKDLQT